MSHSETITLPAPRERRRAAAGRAVMGLLKPVLGPRVPVPVQRQTLELATRAMGTGAAGAARANVGGVPGDRVLPRGAPAARTILYLHGGGYVIGSAHGYRAMTTRIAAAAEAEVVAPDYRRAPENPYPAARDDALSAYEALLGRPDGKAIVLAGDSAGGGLALATAVAIRDAGLPPPKCLVLISPWTDLTLSGETLRSRAAADPVLSPGALERWRALYARETEPADPGLSPLFADHAGLPPMLVQVGTDEILLADSERLAETSAAPVTLERYASLWHDFQLQALLLPTARAALDRIGAFVRAHA